MQENVLKQGEREQMVKYLCVTSVAGATFWSSKPSCYLISWLPWLPCHLLCSWNPLLCSPCRPCNLYFGVILGPPWFSYSLLCVPSAPSLHSVTPSYLFSWYPFLALPDVPCVTCVLGAPYLPSLTSAHVTCALGPLHWPPWRSC